MKVKNFFKNEKGRKEDSFSNSLLHSAGKLSHTKKSLFSYKTGHYSDQCQFFFYQITSTYYKHLQQPMKMKIQYKI